MTPLRSAVLAVGLSLVLSQIAAATAAAADDMVGRRQALESYFRTYRPDGSGPFPALLFVSGCFGFAHGTSAQSYTDMAEGWRAKGYVVVFVDYLAARGRDRCSAITTADIGEDVLAVASYLRTQPFVNPVRISAIGWSLGGGGVLDALAQLDPGESSPLHAVVAYSPVCVTLEPWSAKVPALVLMGANDEMARPAICQQLFTQLPPGTPLETRVYPDAGHVFNLSGGNYNAAATAAAAHDVDQFMSR